MLYKKKYIIIASTLSILAIATYIWYYQKARQVDTAKQDEYENASASGVASGVGLLVGAGLFFVIMIVGVIIMGIIYGGAQAGKAAKNVDADRGFELANKGVDLAGKVKRI